MEVHQYTHLGPADAITAKRCADGTVRLSVFADGHPREYLFITDEQAASLRVDLDTPHDGAEPG